MPLDKSSTGQIFLADPEAQDHGCIQYAQYRYEAASREFRVIERSSEPQSEVATTPVWLRKATGGGTIPPEVTSLRQLHCQLEVYYRRGKVISSCTNLVLSSSCWHRGLLSLRTKKLPCTLLSLLPCALSRANPCPLLLLAT
jgi:hypothetical protein